MVSIMIMKSTDSTNPFSIKLKLVMEMNWRLLGSVNSEVTLNQK